MKSKFIIGGGIGAVALAIFVATFFVLDKG